jgi:hypothetical protein
MQPAWRVREAGTIELFASSPCRNDVANRQRVHETSNNIGDHIRPLAGHEMANRRQLRTGHAIRVFRFEGSTIFNRRPNVGKFCLTRVSDREAIRIPRETAWVRPLQLADGTSRMRLVQFTTTFGIDGIGLAAAGSWWILQF